MLDEADRKLLKVLYDRCLTRHETHGRTPNMLATTVTCMSVLGDIAVQHIGYAVLIVAAGETYDGSPVGSTARAHVRKAGMLAALAVGGAVGTLLVGPVWLARCAWLRVVAPYLQSPRLKGARDRTRAPADRPEAPKPPCDSMKSSKKSQSGTTRSRSSRYES